MDLHEQLRELVAHQGPSVAESAEGFRAALDDYLGEDEATTGQLNLLVDAVRLGAVRRLLETLDHGAEPQAAIHEAGDALARDRGTDDRSRSRWAVAMMGFALGRMDAREIPLIGDSTPVPSADPAPAEVARPESRRPGSRPEPRPPESVRPEPAPETAPVQDTGVTELSGTRTSSVPATEQVPVVTPGPAGPAAPGAGPPWGTGPEGGPSGSPTRQRAARRGAGPLLVGLLVLALVVGAVAVAALADLGPFGEGDDRAPSGTASDPTDDPSDPVTTSGPTDETGALPSSSLLVSVSDDSGASRIVAVDTDSGEVSPLTDGPDDRLPVLSPDRETLIFMRRESDLAGAPYVLDLSGGDPEPLFGEGDPCTYSGRPAWDIPGDRLAVMCTNATGDFVAMHVVDEDGAQIATVPLEGIPKGTPTWISETMLVYAREGTEGVEDSSLWAVDIDTGEETALTSGDDGWDSHPDWSEARDLLLFSRSAVDQFYGDLWLLDAGTAQQLAVGRPVAHPVWGPGGSAVAVTVRAEDNSESLAVIRTDDPADVRLLELDGDPGVPVWDSR